LDSPGGLARVSFSTDNPTELLELPLSLGRLAILASALGDIHFAEDEHRPVLRARLRRCWLRML
jgi:hypothetical protein